MDYRVPYFRPGLSYKTMRDSYMAEFDRVMSSGDLIMRQDLEDFEKNVADYLGVKYFVGVNSGTDAIYIALRAAGIGPGDEVITVSHTFIATIEAIVRCGATPILVDIGSDWLMDMAEVEKAITPKTKAIIPVHLSGDLCDMNRLQELVRGKNIKIIEDAAQAFGAGGPRSETVDLLTLTKTSFPKRAGSYGLAGCFSFYPAKLLGAPGDGGGIATDNAEMYRKCRLLRNHYDVRQTGLKSDAPPEKLEWIGNSRLDNVWAALLNVKFKHIDEILLKRWAVAEVYNRELADIPDLELPQWNGHRVWQDYVIRTSKRDKLKAHLDLAGIETLGHNLIPNHKYPGLGLEHWKLPRTEQYTYEFLRIPCNENLTYDQVKHVVASIKDFFNV